MGSKEDKGSMLGLLRRIDFTCAALHFLMPFTLQLTRWFLFFQGSAWGRARKTPGAFHPVEHSLLLETLFSWLPRWRHPLLGFLLLLQLSLLCQPFLLYLTSKRHSSLGPGYEPCPLSEPSCSLGDLIHFRFEISICILVTPKSLSPAQTTLLISTPVDPIPGHTNLHLSSVT